MSRSIIAVVVAAVIVALTATAYFFTTSTQSQVVSKELTRRVERSKAQMLHSVAIESLGLMGSVETLASQQWLTEALQAQARNDYTTMKSKARLAFSDYFQKESEKKERPIAELQSEIDLALVTKTGDVMYMDGQEVPTAGQFKNGEQVVIPALAEVLGKRLTISDIGRVPGIGLARVAAASIIDHVATQSTGQDVIIGAVVAIVPLTAAAARQQDELLAVRVAYFDAEQVSATSFRRGDGENTQMQATLAGVLDSQKLREAAFDQGGKGESKVVGLSVGGTEYRAATVRLPRFASKTLRPDYPGSDTGALVMVSTGDEAADIVNPARIMILVLGAGALAIALLGMYLTHRRLEAQIDEIEVGVAEIINGNLDRTFRPVGAELDGLANGLNVMLARLLGRPEPGEEAYDENGNPIIPGKVDFEDAGEGPAPAQPQTDPELAALAQEPEPDYYKRLFTEYVAARKQAGSPDDVSFESFIAKLRVNEGKLKAQYQCRAVRFRVVLKDGKVSLKPVPIF